MTKESLHPLVLANLGPTLTPLQQLRAVKQNLTKMVSRYRMILFRKNEFRRIRALFKWRRVVDYLKMQDTLRKVSSTVMWKDSVIDAVESDVKRELQRTATRFDDSSFSSHHSVVGIERTALRKSMDGLKLFDTREALLGRSGFASMSFPRTSRNTSSNAFEAVDKHLNTKVVALSPSLPSFLDDSNDDAGSDDDHRTTAKSASDIDKNILQLYRSLPSSSLPHNRQHYLRAHYPGAIVSADDP